MKLLKRLTCLFRGHQYRSPTFQLNALYFCSCCGREMFDRTLDDLRQMPPMSDEDLENFKRDMEEDQP